MLASYDAVVEFDKHVSVGGRYILKTIINQHVSVVFKRMLTYDNYLMDTHAGPAGPIPRYPSPDIIKAILVSGVPGEEGVKYRTVETCSMHQDQPGITMTRNFVRTISKIETNSLIVEEMYRISNDFDETSQDVNDFGKPKRKFVTRIAFTEDPGGNPNKCMVVFDTPHKILFPRIFWVLPFMWPVLFFIYLFIYIPTNRQGTREAKQHLERTKDYFTAGGIDIENQQSKKHKQQHVSSALSRPATNAQMRGSAAMVRTYTAQSRGSVQSRGSSASLIAPHQLKLSGRQLTAKATGSTAFAHFADELASGEDTEDSEDEAVAPASKWKQEVATVNEIPVAKAVKKKKKKKKSFVESKMPRVVTITSEDGPDGFCKNCGRSFGGSPDSFCGSCGSRRGGLVKAVASVYQQQ